MSNFDLNKLLISDPSITISDHFLLNFDFSVASANSIKRNRKTISFRDINSIDISKLNFDIASELLKLNKNLKINDFVSKFNTSLDKCLDKHAPFITRTITERKNCEYFNDELLKLKRERRACERRLKRAYALNINISQYKKEYADVSKIYFERLKKSRELSNI